MRLKYDFSVREIVGEYVMIPMGRGALEFSGMISTSETGAFLVDALKQNVTRDELLQCILNSYDIDRKTAEADLDSFLNQLRDLNLLVGE